MHPLVKVYFDGGCRPDPVGMETAVVVRGRSFIQRGLGSGSSMDAEWLALIRAVEIAQELGLTNPLFLGDSLAVVGQATGTVKRKGASVGHFLAMTEMQSSPGRLKIRHVKRAQNLAGIALVRLHAR